MTAARTWVGVRRLVRTLVLSALLSGEAELGQSQAAAERLEQLVASGLSCETVEALLAAEQIASAPEPCGE